MPIKSKDKKRQMWESWEADSIGKAKEEALCCGGTVSVLKARLDVAYTPEGKASPLPTLVGAQRALVDALGGEMKGVHSADILCDDRHHPQYHRGVTICIIETPGPRHPMDGRASQQAEGRDVILLAREAFCLNSSQGGAKRDAPFGRSCRGRGAQQRRDYV
jgi:hypothetical protein